MIKKANAKLRILWQAQVSAYYNALGLMQGAYPGRIQLRCHSFCILQKLKYRMVHIVA